MPLKKEIVYPIFLECCQYANDNYWENVFEDLAYGKAPYGTYISKGFLCCSYKKKDFSYKIERKNSKEIYDEVYNLLSNKLGLLSQEDKIKKRKVFIDIENSLSDARKTWNDIRKKNIKELLIELYVTKMKNKYSLTIKQSRYLLSIIYVGLVFKVLTSKDINYSNGEIVSIKGIEFTKRNVIVKKDLYNLDTNFTTNIIFDKKLLSDNWDKYIKEQMKNTI
tara:strand:- start:104 stop:769 length:666 start_codon:yes stop_codon:yes gene_type:complete